MSAAFDPTSSALGITLVYLVLGAGALVFLGSLAIQLRGLGRALRPSADGPVLWGTSAASLGLASIVGSALAIELGGPGALPWMWVATFLGMGLVWASVTAAGRTREQEQEPILQASPIRSMRAALGSAGAALAIIYALTISIAALAVGALLHGQQLGALFNSLAGTPPGITAGLLAVLAAPLILSAGTQLGDRLRLLSPRVLPLALLIYIAVALAVLIGDAPGTQAALTHALSSATMFTSDAAVGGVSGGALAALTHAVLRTTMTGPGLGLAAFAPEIAKAKDREGASARAMLGPLLGAGVIGSLTALTLLSHSATYGPPGQVVTERELVFLEAHQSRALLPSERGQTIVLPDEADTPLEEGKLYAMVLRGNPRGHKVGQLLVEDNMVVVPEWKITAQTDTIVLRDNDPKRNENAGFDTVIPCTRGIAPTRAGNFVTLTPKDPSINLRALMNARGLGGPYVVLGDYHFTGTVERAVSGHPRFGEHLALYQPEGEAPTDDPSLREVLQLGFRGPYVDSDEEPLPPALVGVEGFLPEVGSVVHLRIEPPARGLDLGFINRAKELETPAWDSLAAAQSVVLRHLEDPAQDVKIPVVAREKQGRLRFNTAVSDFSFRAMETMTSHEGPFILPAPIELTVEVHGDARLPARFAGRRALIPLAKDGRPLPDLQSLFADEEIRGPTVAVDGAGALSRVWQQGLGTAGTWGSWAAALATFLLGIIGANAWAGVGATSLSQILGAGAGAAYRLVFVALCSLGCTLTLAEILGIADVTIILAAQVHLIALVAMLPRILARRR